MLKKILIIVLVSFIALPSLAYEHYMLIADKQVSNIRVYNQNIISVKPVISENCKSNTMIVIAHSEGKTKFSFCKGKKRMNLWVKVKKHETCIEGVNGIKAIKMDFPPELLDTVKDCNG